MVPILTAIVTGVVAIVATVVTQWSSNKRERAIAARTLLRERYTELRKVYEQMFELQAQLVADYYLPGPTSASSIRTISSRVELLIMQALRVDAMMPLANHPVFATEAAMHRISASLAALEKQLGIDQHLPKCTADDLLQDVLRLRIEHNEPKEPVQSI